MIKVVFVKGLQIKSARHVAAFARAITRGAIVVQGKARRAIMDGPKTGNEYPRGKNVHKASAPGEAPANDTGNLAGSVTVVNAQPGPQPEAIVIAGARYAKWLEYGTKDGKLKPRPFMRPAAESSIEQINKYILEELGRA